jgi:hypothetical protein
MYYAHLSYLKLILNIQRNIRKLINGETDSLKYLHYVKFLDKQSFSNKYPNSKSYFNLPRTTLSFVSKVKAEEVKDEKIKKECKQKQYEQKQYEEKELDDLLKKIYINIVSAQPINKRNLEFINKVAFIVNNNNKNKYINISSNDDTKITDLQYKNGIKFM